jgi:uncharacterized protein (TIGR00269 family)
VVRTVSRYRLLKPDDKIAVALSGGKDSVVLLHILEKIERSFPRSQLLALTVDEGIEGYRSDAIKIARENCQELGVEHHLISFTDLYGYNLDEMVKVAKEKRSGLSACSICGVLRRKALNVLARDANATKIALAHNLDDEVQTFLMNILQGNLMRIAYIGPKGDGLPGFVERVKPLCRIPEREVALYAYLKELSFQPDPCPFMHEAIRSDVRLALNRLEVKHAGLKFSIFNSIERLRSLLRKEVKVKLNPCRICGELTVSDVCRACESLRELGLILEQ